MTLAHRPELRPKKPAARDHGAPVVLTSAASAYAFVRPTFRDRPHGSLLVLALNARCTVIGQHELTRATHHGAYTGYTSTPDVFGPPRAAGAAAILLVHTHPSGSCEPCADDVVMTRKLAYAGERLGVPVLDHLVLGGGAYFSMRDVGILD